MYRDVTVYRLVAGGSDERLRTLMADNSALHAEIPGLVSYSLTRSDPSRDSDYVVRMAVSGSEGPPPRDHLVAPMPLFMSDQIA